MPRLEENRYLPVFVLLALIITLQSFLIGEDRKAGDLDRPVVSQQTPFVAAKNRERPAVSSHGTQAPTSPPLSTTGTETNAVDMDGPPLADADKDGGWVRYQAGATMPDDDLDEPPVAAPSAASTAVAGEDDANPLAEETSPDEADVNDKKDEWARPGSLGAIIQHELAPPSAREALPDGVPGIGTVLRPTPARPAPAPRSATVAVRVPPASAPAAGRSRSSTCEVDIGDNLWRIAKRYRVSPEEILKANNLQSGVLLPGQVLIIPSEPQQVVPKGFDVTRVRAGETAIDVANRIGVPLIDLVRENDLASLYEIPEGTVLRYRKAGPVTGAAAATEPSSNPEKSGLSFPVAGRVGDRFGWRKHPILGETLFHTGIDLKAGRGEPIKASQEGRVIYAGWLRGYGQTLVLRHAGGYTTRYAHCSALLKKRGERVRRGEKIARVGSSGLSTGPHVHFEVRHLGRPLNPLKFLKRGGARS